MSAMPSEVYATVQAIDTSRIHSHIRRRRERRDNDRQLSPHGTVRFKPGMPDARPEVTE